MNILVLISGLTFLTYGFLCLSSVHMVQEFERYGLSNYRVLTGVLEVLGGAGLIIGIFYKVILLISSGGLTILMLLGFITRLRISDPFIQSLPALSLMILNGYLFISYSKVFK